jgi:hypothetical protein
LLGTPHIWFFHHASDPSAPHRRSLVSRKTMADQRRGDAHGNGTIWAAALWELRSGAIGRGATPDEGRRIDRLLLQALLLIGAREAAMAEGEGDGDGHGDLAVAAAGDVVLDRRVRACARARGSFRRAGAALLEADALLYRRAFRDEIARALAARGIRPEASREPGSDGAGTVDGVAVAR